MNDPLKSLEAFYEACDDAQPSRMIPDPDVMARIRVQAALRVLGTVIGPLFVGAVAGLLILTLGASPQPRSGNSPLDEILKYRLLEAGLSKNDFPRPQDASRDRTEVPSWRA